MNPFTNKPYSTEALKIRAQQKIRFPTTDPLILKEFDEIYKKNDVIIIKAATGTGKGVVIAPRVMLLENVKPTARAPPGLDHFNGGIQLTTRSRVVITEPRTTNTLVATHLKVVLDAPQVVDYTYRFAPSKLTDQTLLAFVTDGFLLNFFYNDITLPNYNVVIIDEVHERNKNIDQLLCFLKLTGKKTIILSATIDIAEYRNYFEQEIVDSRFGDLLLNRKLLVGSMEIGGVTFPVTDIFIKSEDDYISQAIRVVKQICSEGKPGDILIFLASANELRKACKTIYSAGLRVACMELHRSTQDEVKEVIIDELRYRDMKFNNQTPERKVVFSTNVAESGITVNGIIFVIDSGRRLESSFNSEDQVYELTNRFISRAEAEQRRGRAGRTQPGTCYHLYSEEEYNSLFSAFKSPEILTEEISDIILALLNSEYSGGQIDRVTAILDHMMTPPTRSQVEFAMKFLTQLKLIDDEKSLTKLGREVAKAGLGLSEAITYIAGRSFGIDFQICQIMAMINVEPDVIKWFVEEPSDPQRNKEYRRQIAHWTSSMGEIFVLRDMFDGFMKNTNEQWCVKHYLLYTKFVKARKQFYKLRETIKTILPLFESISGTDNEKIREAFCRGYPLNIATRKDSVYQIDRPAKYIKVDRPDALTKLGKKILYLDITKIAGQIKISNIINL